MLRKILIVFAGCLFLVTVSNVADAYLEKSGNVSGETWAEDTYLVISNLTVNHGTTLTIEAGAVVKFQPGLLLTVYGTLDVNGVDGNNVVFTSRNDNTYGEIIPESNGLPAPGDGGHIYLYGLKENDGIGRFDWCRVRYGGNYYNVYFMESASGYFNNSISEYSADIGLQVYNCSPTITKSTFTNNMGNGLYAYNASSPIVTDNTFTDNGGYGAYLYSVTLTSYSGNSGSGNGINGFGVSGTMTADCTWSLGSSAFPFVLVGDGVSVNDNVTLKLSAGTIIKAVADLSVYGTLDANGSSVNPIIFTSLKDDSYGGDTNNDGNATSPAPGDGGHIYLYGLKENDGIGRFDWCRVRYGGNYYNVYFMESASGYFNNSISEYNANIGLQVYNCSPTIRGSRIENNTGYGIYISSGTPDLGANDPQDKGRNTILNNDSGNYQVYNATSSPINAYYNFWGYTTAPEIDAHIRDDEEGGGEVFFDPWLYSDEAPPWEEPSYPYGIVCGTVRDAATSEAIPNVTIQVDGADSTNTDAEGKYLLTLSTGMHTIGAIVEGYIPFKQVVTVPGDYSKVQLDIQLYPSGTALRVNDITSKYCDKTQKAYFLDGIPVDISFKAIVDWGEHYPGSIRFVTPEDTYEGLVDTRTFDVGSEFGVDGQLKVIAVAEDGAESKPYIANFEVVPIPPGIPNNPDLLNPNFGSPSGHVLKYGSSLGWDLTAIDEGVEEGTVPDDIPGFGGKAFKFVAEMELGVEITSEGEAKAWATKPLDGFEIAGCKSTPQITAEVVWEYSPVEGDWAPGGGICLALDLDCTTAPHYFTIPVGPIPIPGYWRAGVEVSLDTCVELIGWLESAPELKGDISLEVLGKFILGIGIADVLAVEGELKGGPNLTLQYPAEPHLLSFVLHIEGTARVVLLFYTWSPGSITYDWELTGAESAIQAVKLATLPPLDQFQPLERNYLNEGFPMFVGDNQLEIFAQAGVFSGENTIVINEYPYSDPDLATQDGQRILVWLTDDPLRSDNNRTKVMWSMWEDERWTEPIAIDDDGTADFEPEVEMLPDGDALATWVNCSQSFDDNADLEDLLQASEITVAKYHSASGMWESIQQMTSNSHLEHTPHLCVADDGTAMLVWISNPANHVIGSSTEPNQLWYSFFDGAVWNPPALVADVFSILKSDLAYDGENAVYIYSADMDDDLTTEEDEEIYGITYAGGLWSAPAQLTNDSVKDTNPDVEYTSLGSLMLLWYKDNRIVQSDDLVFSTFNEVVQTGVSSGAADFSLAVGSGNNISIVWQDASYEGVDLWTATYDPELHVWSLPYQLTFDLDLEQNITAGYDSGKLVLVYNKAEVIETDEQISIGQSDLCWLERQIGTDLAVSADDVSFSPANPVPGKECTISAIIHNLGDLAVENVLIDFYYGNPAEGGELIEDATVDNLLAGSHSEPISIAWTPPDEITEPKDIYVVVDPDEVIPDRARSNNTCSRRVIKPDLTIQEIYTQQLGKDKISTAFRVVNIGTIPAENIQVELRKDAPDGELLSELQIEKLGQDVFEDKSVVLDIKDCGIEHYVVIDAAATIEEFNEDNNVASVTIPRRLPGDVSGNDKVTAYDASLVLRYVVGLTDLSFDERQAADVTGDETVTALDAALILQYTVGLITAFPVQSAPILVVKDDNQLLTEIIAELENSSLSTEQQRVLEQLKHLLWQQTLPKQTALLQNYPNPFNPETWLPYQLAQDAPVTIRIYNTKGQLIRALHLGARKAGIYVAKDKAAYWDGRDKLGQKVASGVYYYTLQAGNFRTTRKMVILK